MKMNIPKYLQKKQIQGPWNFNIFPNKEKYELIITIPSYSEYNYLPKTLESINEQNYSNLKNVLVVVIVNNSTNVSKNIFDNNKKTLNLLNTFIANFELRYIDASSYNLSFSAEKAGVGFSRKLMIDLCLPFCNEKTIICCTDADTILHPDYIYKIHNYFNHKKTYAVSIGFKHQNGKTSKEQTAINQYENYLYNTAKKIKACGLPYGYVSIGSAMAFSIEAYISIGGMNTKKATEDFYFLQEIAKTWHVDIINDVLVFPSSRISNRVHLGTGYNINKIINGTKSFGYSNLSFTILKKFVYIIKNNQNHIDDIINKVQSLDNKIYEFLSKKDFKKILIKNSTQNVVQFETQILKWFDALKVMQLLKHIDNQ